MSYDIYIKKRNKKTNSLEYITLRSKHQIAGHTYCLGGTNEAWLNITYNFAGHFIEKFGEKGIRSLYGIPMDEAIQKLVKAIDSFGDVKPTKDPWDDSPGNAKLALQKLLTLAELCVLENKGEELVIDGD